MPSTPPLVILNDTLAKQNAFLAKLEKYLELAYLAQQEDESTKTPQRYRPYVVNVNNNLGNPGGATSLALQVLPRNEARDSFSLYNVGPGDLLYSPTQFDPASILQQFSDPSHPNAFLPAPNQVVQIGYLPSGSSVNIDASEPLWVANIGGAALAMVTESIYARAGDAKSGTLQSRVDGAIGQGYEVTSDIEGNAILSKGLR